MTEIPPLPAAETVVSGRRILIVDDNRDAAISLSMLLELSGNKTETAYDGLAAIDAAARFEPDVVLLDIGLPGLNGYEVARRMRNEPWGKQVKLVAVTGWGHPEDRERAIAAGFDAHLLKPVDHAALVKLLAGAGTPHR
ncbi:MAG: response regulator [Betaproteobacteria bacterium]|nr:response regulator [Betaproteobacteria bacterium]